MLADDPFQSKIAGLPVEPLAVRLDVVPHADRPRVAGEQLVQRLLAGEERRLAEVVAVEVEEVEGEVDEVVLPVLGEGVLEGLEAGGAVRLQDHHLAVEDRLDHRELLGLAGHRGEAIGPVLAVAGDQTGLAVADLAEGAVAVVFDLVDPLVALRDLLD